MFIRNYDGFASPPRVSRPRRDFFSKLIAKGGDACCADSLPIVDKEILANEDLTSILYDASMVHAFVIPNQASLLAAFEIDSDENSIVASKVCFSVLLLIAFVVFGQPQLGFLLRRQIESLGRSDGCQAIGECSCSRKEAEGSCVGSSYFISGTSDSTETLINANVCFADRGGALSGQPRPGRAARSHGDVSVATAEDQGFLSIGAQAF